MWAPTYAIANWSLGAGLFCLIDHRKRCSSGAVILPSGFEGYLLGPSHHQTEPALGPVEFWNLVFAAISGDDLRVGKGDFLKWSLEPLTVSKLLDRNFHCALQKVIYQS